MTISVIKKSRTSSPHPVLASGDSAQPQARCLKPCPAGVCVCVCRDCTVGSGREHPPAQRCHRTLLRWTGGDCFLALGDFSQQASASPCVREYKALIFLYQATRGFISSSPALSHLSPLRRRQSVLPDSLQGRMFLDIYLHCFAAQSHFSPRDVPSGTGPPVPHTAFLRGRLRGWGSGFCFLKHPAVC